MKQFDSFGIMGLGGKMETMQNKQKIKVYINMKRSLPQMIRYVALLRYFSNACILKVKDSTRTTLF